VVLVFWSYKCPVVLAANQQFNAFQAKYEGKGITLLGVDSSSNETPEEISRNAAHLKITFPYLIDSDKVLASNLRATHAPTLFVIDRDREVRYQGAFDNNKKEGSKDREPYADNAIDDLLAGKSPELRRPRRSAALSPKKQLAPGTGLLAKHKFGCRLPGVQVQG